jgi:hypothetical protein
MDLFLAACQGAGLALATGAFGGASGRRGGIGSALLVAAVIGGAALFGISLEAEDHPAYPGWPLGALLAGFAFVVVRELAEATGRRAEGGGFTAAMIAFAALILAGLSILLPPISLLALAGLIWLSASRRRRAARKYAGLRTLR